MSNLVQGVSAPEVKVDPAQPASAQAGSAGAPAATAEGQAAAGKAPEKEDKFSSRFAALSRREKQILAKEAQVKELDRQMAEERKKYQGYESRELELEREIKNDPLGFMKKFGLTYDELTKLVLNDQKPTAEMKISRLEERLEREANERREREERALNEQKEKEKETYAKQEQDYVKHLDSFIGENAEKYELLSKEEEAGALVFNVMQGHFNEHKKVLSQDEAAEAVESWLEKQIEEKYLSSPKIKAKLGLKDGPEASKPLESGQNQMQPPRTLTNSQQTSAPTQTKGQALTVEESRALAAKVLKWV